MEQLSNFSNPTEKDRFSFSFLKKKVKLNETAYTSMEEQEQRNQQKNPLDEISIKFIEYIIKNKKNIIDINKSTEELNIPKRRIYDIINVLEGKPTNYIFLKKLILLFIIYYRNWIFKKVK